MKGLFSFYGIFVHFIDNIKEMLTLSIKLLHLYRNNVITESYILNKKMRML